MRALIIALSAALAVTSCGSRWSDAEEKAFVSACLESEAARGTSELTARAYCECALDKTSKRYATAVETAANKDSIGMTQDLEICRRSTR